MGTAAWWELMVILLCVAMGLGLAVRRAPLWTWTLAIVGIIFVTQIWALKGGIRDPSFGMLSVCAWVLALRSVHFPFVPFVAEFLSRRSIM